MNSESTQDVQDCAVCLQKFNYPTQLPCGHIFCFLCVKGVAIQSKKCAMCRAEIPHDYLDHPVLLENILPEQERQQTNEFQWYYEGRNGWWKYDERSNCELEAAFNGGETVCKLLLAGALYCIDFNNMIQVQSRDPTRRRRVRRDTSTLPAKGIAGIKIAENEQTKIENSQSNTENQGDVVEIEDDDDENDATHSGHEDNVADSPQNSSFNNIIQRISSLDVRDENQSEISNSRMGEM